MVSPYIDERRNEMGNIIIQKVGTLRIFVFDEITKEEIGDKQGFIAFNHWYEDPKSKTQDLLPDVFDRYEYTFDDSSRRTTPKIDGVNIDVVLSEKKCQTYRKYYLRVGIYIPNYIPKKRTFYFNLDINEQRAKYTDYKYEALLSKSEAFQLNNSLCRTGDIWKFTDNYAKDKSRVEQHSMIINRTYQTAASWDNLY
jgi:hypothetical protein